MEFYHFISTVVSIEYYCDESKYYINRFHIKARVRVIQVPQTKLALKRIYVTKDTVVLCGMGHKQTAFHLVFVHGRDKQLEWATEQKPCQYKMGEQFKLSLILYTLHTMNSSRILRCQIG